MVAEEVLRAACEVGELRGGHIDPQTLIQRGKDVAEMNRPGPRFLAPARGRAEDLAASQATTGNQRLSDLRGQ